MFAKFVFSPTVGAWSLKRREGNGRWHAYESVDNVRHFREALWEVETDASAIFLG